MGRVLGVQFEELESPDRERLARHRVMTWVDKLIATPLAIRADTALIKMAEEALSGFSKQELVARLVNNLAG